MKKFNPDMMIMGRDRLGMSQSALAAATGLKQYAISRFESGLAVPTADQLLLIGEALDRPVGFLQLEEQTYGASATYHRSRKLTMGEERRIQAQVNELRIHASTLLREAEIESRFSFHRLKLDEGGPEKAAQTLRQLWQLPSGPIRSVVGAIEKAGGLVFRCPFDTDKLDGVSQWPLDDDRVPPVIFVREDAMGDRQRFTLGHEIGHVVLHHLPTDDPESEADRFASEFLMPAREIGPELSRITLQKAAALKCYWKVSMASIIRKARDLDKITERQYRSLMLDMSRLGYRKCEPVPLPPEEPAMFREILELHRTTYGRDVDALSSLLGLYPHQFVGLYGRSGPNLRIAG
ncbi:MAG: XRE family transcriptional regulator [Isosphaeraceae bacterium]